MRSDRRRCRRNAADATGLTKYNGRYALPNGFLNMRASRVFSFLNNRGGEWAFCPIPLPTLTLRIEKGEASGPHRDNLNSFFISHAGRFINRPVEHWADTDKIPEIGGATLNMGTAYI